MADIINLRDARKARERALRTAEAAGNRARSGRTKADKERTAKEAERRDTDMDGKKID
ncbi:MAG: DUF4169 family protein [Alphaproteobacteria bacterium]